MPADNFQGKADSMVPGTAIDIYSAATNNDWVMENIKIMSFENSKAAAGVSTPTTIQSATAITLRCLLTV